MFSVTKSLYLLASLCLLLLGCRSRTPVSTPSLETTVASKKEPSAEVQIATQARARLEAWQNTRAVKHEIPLRICYWSPKGRAPILGHEQRIRSVILETQEFFRQEMLRHGYGNNTFTLETDQKGQLIIHTLNSHTPQHKNANKDFTTAYDELTQLLLTKGIDISSGPTFIFLNTAKWEASQSTIAHPMPYIGLINNNPITNCCWSIDSPLLDPQPPINHPITFIENHRHTKYANISLKTYQQRLQQNIRQQIGYTLGLATSNDPPSTNAKHPTFLMHYVNWTNPKLLDNPVEAISLSKADAMMLSSHASVSGSTKGIYSRVYPNVTDLQLHLSETNQLSISGEIISSIPAYGIVYQIWKRHPNPQAAPTMTSYTAAISHDNRFAFSLPQLQKKEHYKLIIAFLYANGWNSQLQLRQTSYDITFTTDENGAPDVASMQEVAELTQLGLLVSSNDYSGVQRELARIKSASVPPKTMAVAKSLAKSFLNDETYPTAAEIPETIRQIPLSRLSEDSFQVGWGTILKDRLPTTTGLLSHSGRLFAHGIYAHAPSLGVYQLNKKWHRFTGSAAIVEGKGGAARFIVLGDGKELWRSDVIEYWRPMLFDIDIRGVTTLHIKIEPEEGRKNACWSVWFSPILHR